MYLVGTTCLIIEPFVQVIPQIVQLILAGQVHAVARDPKCSVVASQKNVLRLASEICEVRLLKHIETY